MLLRIYGRVQKYEFGASKMNPFGPLLITEDTLSGLI